MYHFIIARSLVDRRLSVELIDDPTSQEPEELARAVFDDDNLQIIDGAPADFSAVVGAANGTAVRDAQVILDALLNLDTIPGEPKVRLVVADVYALGVNAGLRIAGVSCPPRWW